MNENSWQQSKFQVKITFSIFMVKISNSWLTSIQMKKNQTGTKERKKLISKFLKRNFKTISILCDLNFKRARPRELNY